MIAMFNQAHVSVTPLQASKQAHACMENNTTSEGGRHPTLPGEHL
jgi:hypothetical protein